MDYRKRCYDAYNLLWDQTHTLSLNEYELYAKIAKKRYLPFLPADKSAPIIDVACGAGHFLYFLKKENYTNIKGIDISKIQVEIAKTIGLAEVEEANLFEYLRCHPEEYEMVVANDIIEHLTKEEVFTFLDIIYSAIKPGGRVLISTINASSFFGPYVVYIDFTHELGFTVTSLTQVLRVCGFDDVKVFGNSPIVHDFKSFVHSTLWSIRRKILGFYHLLEFGTGRGIWKFPIIFEPTMFAVATKPAK